MPRSRFALPRSVGCGDSCRDTHSESVSVSECISFTLRESLWGRFRFTLQCIDRSPDRVEQYSEPKRTLAAQYPNDIDEYMNGKGEFVKRWHNEPCTGED
ncbi:GrpB family protein [Nodosilinea sp. FACHB-131]|uniref:GrpB family protein n=1 Tax=Leptolyngbya subtilissima TaxID=1346803 RepID=UPI001A7EB9A8